MFYTYILKSEKDNTLYIGSTSNIPKRFKKHNDGLNKFTKGHRPYKILSYTAFTNRKKAVRFEKYLKTASGKAFLNKRLI